MPGKGVGEGGKKSLQSFALRFYKDAFEGKLKTAGATQDNGAATRPGGET